MIGDVHNSLRVICFVIICDMIYAFLCAYRNEIFIDLATFCQIDLNYLTQSGMFYVVDPHGQFLTRCPFRTHRTPGLEGRWTSH